MARQNAEPKPIKDPRRARSAALVRELRFQKGFTQSEFAGLFGNGLSGQTISLWEKGTLPEPEHRAILAQLKGWSLDQFETYLNTGLEDLAGKIEWVDVFAKLEAATDIEPVLQVLRTATNTIARLAS
jgi:transcriptional regulator with XRE-family HTH domain